MPLTPPAAARRLPSMPAMVFLLMVLILPGAYGSRMLNADGDLARHLRQGREILESGDVNRTDRFSWPMAGEPFVSFEYGSQVLLALTERTAGLAGIVLLATLLLAGAHALLARFLVRRDVDPVLALLVASFSAMVAQVHWIARPHLITIFITVILLDWLDREKRPAWWQFALLYLVWANLHAGFIFGLGLMGVWMAGEFGEGLLDRASRPASWKRARSTRSRPAGLDRRHSCQRVRCSTASARLRQPERRIHEEPHQRVHVAGLSLVLHQVVPGGLVGDPRGRALEPADNLRGLTCS